VVVLTIAVADGRELHIRKESIQAVRGSRPRYDGKPQSVLYFTGGPPGGLLIEPSAEAIALCAELDAADSAHKRATDGGVYLSAQQVFAVGDPVVLDHDLGSITPMTGRERCIGQIGVVCVAQAVEYPGAQQCLRVRFGDGLWWCTALELLKVTIPEKSDA